MLISKDNVPKQKVVTFYLFYMKRDETGFQGRDFFYTKALSPSLKGVLTKKDATPVFSQNTCRHSLNKFYRCPKAFMVFGPVTPPDDCVPQPDSGPVPPRLPCIGIYHFI